MTEQKYIDIIEKVARVEHSAKSAHKRLDDLEPLVKSIYEMAGDIKILTKEIAQTREDVKSLKICVDQTNAKPGKMIDTLKTNAINYIIMALLGVLMALIFKS